MTVAPFASVSRTGDNPAARVEGIRTAPADGTSRRFDSLDSGDGAPLPRCVRGLPHQSGAGLMKGPPPPRPPRSSRADEQYWCPRRRPTRPAREIDDGLARSLTVPPPPAAPARFLRR